PSAQARPLHLSGRPEAGTRSGLAADHTGARKAAASWDRMSLADRPGRGGGAGRFGAPARAREPGETDQAEQAEPAPVEALVGHGGGFPGRRRGLLLRHGEAGAADRERDRERQRTKIFAHHLCAPSSIGSTPNSAPVESFRADADAAAPRSPARKPHRRDAL